MTNLDYFSLEILLLVAYFSKKKVFVVFIKKMQPLILYIQLSDKNTLQHAHC